MTRQDTIEIAGLTDVGLRRERNEDQYAIATLGEAYTLHQASFGPRDEIKGPVPTPTLLAVADGMGGHGGGDVASRVVLQSILRAVESGDPVDTFEGVVPGLVAGAERDLDQAADESAEHPSMGTTLTLARVQDLTATVAHVGDSRAYLLRDQSLKQLTTDHTLAEQLRRELQTEEAAAPESPMHHILYNALQAHSEREAEVDVFKVELQAEDVLLLCSDGLSKELDGAMLGQILAGNPGLSQAAQALVEAAKDAGGTDNITVVLARVPA
ncbi:MAG: protein phosphatase 2C domain-containing protein [Myxococcota bacterium]